MLRYFLNISALTPVYLGLAVGQNPGYLKLRKIRAAQNISRTVSIFINVQTLLIF